MKNLKDTLLSTLSLVENQLKLYDTQSTEEHSLSKEAYFKIKLELERMIVAMDKSQYLPAYPRFLVDYPETELINTLLKAAYLYKTKT